MINSRWYFTFEMWRMHLYATEGNVGWKQCRSIREFAAFFQDATAYEHLMGRWSRRLAPSLI